MILFGSEKFNALDPSTVSTIWKSEWGVGDLQEFRLHWRYRNDTRGNHENAAFHTEKERDSAYDQLYSAMKGNRMFSGIAQDTKEFIKENKSIIYWLALAFLVDHFFFHGAFREKLHALVNKLIGKVEKQIDSKMK